MRIILAFIALMSAAPALAQQPASASNQQTDQQQKQQTSPDDRGTSNRPLIIKQLADEHSETEDRESHEKAENDRELVRQTMRLADDTGWLAVATWALFGATVLLWAFTALMWRATARAVRDGEQALRHARQSAIASVHQARSSRRHVRLAERSFYDLERPYIFLTDIQPINNWMRIAHSSGNIVDVPTEFVVQYAFNNHGRTPAIVKEINFAVDYVNELPEIPIYSEKSKLRGDIIIGGNAARSIDYRTDSYRLSTEDREKWIVGPETREFFFFGYILYEDVFGNTYRRGHGFKYFRKANGFNTLGLDAYNYDRRESGDASADT